MPFIFLSNYFLLINLLFKHYEKVISQCYI